MFISYTDNFWTVLLLQDNNKLEEAKAVGG